MTKEEFTKGILKAQADRKEQKWNKKIDLVEYDKAAHKRMKNKRKKTKGW